MIANELKNKIDSPFISNVGPNSFRFYRKDTGFKIIPIKILLI